MSPKLYAQMSIRVEGSLLQRLKAAAARLHESQQGYVIRAVEERLSREAPDTAISQTEN